MAIIKCKMCGGDLVLVEGQSVAECEYCGSKQTVPAADNEKKLTLFARANRLRAACEFDKAAGIYEAIVADFPEEAEAYWGLVLCKYGIEYVDDPATGKKIPTCHRSSFDSVMDDGNFEQAMENADEVALRVYRQEAKQIEGIRKGILEVSSSEKPYDIFICYKETDSSGDRTVDSLLAQDIYDALISKGYRVFFSRITLEDKLGQAYEPYIFAALNSAKIMLAVGTCYEHYNAVWVKNEWSRYLKIIAQDKNKYLIPCYKGLDAYDMPKEFAHLQGQDMGKVGAIADLLRGIEKLMPRQNSNTVVVQEKVVVGNAGGSNKIASLLDRGNMALEDGDWAKADSFFEDVLNNDSKNAQAYLGKTLAQEKCRTMDALVRKRRDVYQNVSSEKLYIQEKFAHISEMAEQYSLPGYVDSATIRNLYQFDLSYTSEVSNRQKQYREEENWWQNHRWLSRAEKFAVGAVAQTIQNEKNHLFAQLADRVKKAQEADNRSIARLEAAYDAHIVEADKKAEQFYNDGLAKREQDYKAWLEGAKRETNPEALKKLSQNFTGLGDYKDSKNLADHCCKRAAEEQNQIDVENQIRGTLAEQEAHLAQLYKDKNIFIFYKLLKRISTSLVFLGFLYLVDIISGTIGEFLLGLAIFAFLPLRIISLIIWWKLWKKYEEFYNVDVSLSNKKFLKKYLKKTIPEVEASIGKTRAQMGDESERQWIIALKRRKAQQKRKKTITVIAATCVMLIVVVALVFMKVIIPSKAYKEAEALLAQGDTNGAAEAFAELGDFKDAQERNWEIRYLEAEKMLATGNSYGAAKSFGAITNHRDAWERSLALWGELSNRETISAGDRHTVGLKEDGTAIAVGRNDYGICEISEWTDLIAMGTGIFHTVGLRNDGSVVSTKFTGEHYFGQGDVKDWSDIVAISAGDYHTVGLRSDGTIMAVGSNRYGECNVGDWTDIIAISAGGSHTVGLKRDGSVIAAGSNSDGQCEVYRWRDIVAISAGEKHTVGLKEDGTVVAVGDNYGGPCEVSTWRHIVAISAGDLHTVGLRSDGTVVATDDSEISDYFSYGQCTVGNWRDIVAISAGSYHTVGLKADGTVVATECRQGVFNRGQCDVKNWSDIKLPE